MSCPRESVLCIVGPTAVGKSAVAERVALRLGGEVVSVDSMQVYKGMDIGTAKTPVAERMCTLHMVDVADLGEPYSVSQFQSSARACIQGLIEQHKVPVLCGGTGLYLDAVIDDMRFPHGETGSSARASYERIAREFGPESLHALLAQRDAESAAQIHPNNVRRVVRALEMLDEGVSYARTHEGLKRREPYYTAHMWALTLPREELYRRINDRVDAMFEQGLLDEVRELVDQGLLSSPTAAAAIGYKETVQVLLGELSEDEARQLVKRNTRRYAKRQLSWIHRDGRARWIDLSNMSFEDAIQTICDDWENDQQ